MMMPANFSAVSENEMTYVVGGSLVDVLVPVMTEKEWQKVNLNLVSIVGNTFVGKLVNATVAPLFTGSYVPGQIFSTVTGALGYKYKTGSEAIVSENKFLRGANGVLNAALSVVGGLAAVYTLGRGDVKIELPKIL
jgi:hypothetical protein